MIDIRKLKELVRLMVENELSELDIKDQQETVTIKRGSTGPTINHQPVIYQGGGPAPVARAAPIVIDSGDDDDAPAAAPTPAPAPAPAATMANSDAGLVAITSPMVGTFYSSPNPDSPLFVNVGAAVTPDTTVCLIEAMKVFNEIKAEQSGTVEKVLVKSGQAVEYGQKLFMIRPA